MAKGQYRRRTGVGPTVGETDRETFVGIPAPEKERVLVRREQIGLFQVPVGTKQFSDATGEYRCDPETGWAVEKLA